MLFLFIDFKPHCIRHLEEAIYSQPIQNRQVRD